MDGDGELNMTLSKSISLKVNSITEYLHLISYARYLHKPCGGDYFSALLFLLG